MKKNATKDTKYNSRQVIHSNRDFLSRQIREGVQIRRSSKPILNSRTEWFQPPLFRILNDVIRE